MNKELCIKIGRRLYELRKNTGKSQSVIAEMIGVQIRTYASYERAESGSLPPTKVLLNLADLYGVSVDYLLCRTDFRTGTEGEYFSEKTGLTDDAIKTLIMNRQTAVIEKNIRENIGIKTADAKYNLLPDTISFLLRSKHTDVLNMIGTFITSDDLVLSDDVPKTLQTENVNGSGICFDTAEVFKDAIPNAITRRLYELRDERLKNRKKAP